MRIVKHLHELLGNMVLAVMAHLERFSYKRPGIRSANMHLYGTPSTRWQLQVQDPV